MPTKYFPHRASKKKLPEKIVLHRDGHIYMKAINMSKNYLRYKDRHTEIESSGNNKDVIRLVYISMTIRLVKVILEAILVYKTLSG